MGLKQRLITGQTNLSSNNGAPSSFLKASSQESNLHGRLSGLPGYSLDGSDFINVNKNYQEYSDGVPNLLPAPSTLDLNGATPKSPLSTPRTRRVNNTFSKGTYRDNPPEGAQAF